jgi:hypothetical protein
MGMHGFAPLSCDEEKKSFFYTELVNTGLYMFFLCLPAEHFTQVV